jgi:hypothetical protein
VVEEPACVLEVEPLVVPLAVPVLLEAGVPVLEPVVAVPLPVLVAAPLGSVGAAPPGLSAVEMPPVARCLVTVTVVIVVEVGAVVCEAEDVAEVRGVAPVTAGVCAGGIELAAESEVACAVTPAPESLVRARVTAGVTVGCGRARWVTRA